MKTTVFSLIMATALVFATDAFGSPSKTYQVTGPILEMNESIIAVQKGKERWEVARDANTKANGELKVGDKVTITYTMTAANVELKPAKDNKSAKADTAAGTPAASASPAKK